MSEKAYARPTARARDLRASATEAERVVWAHLSARKVAGVRFSRQVPTAPFICDFVSGSAKRGIEVDGGQHGWNTDADRSRTRFIESQGFAVIRFWNGDIPENIEGLVGTIERASKYKPSPNPFRKREGSKEACRAGRSIHP